MKKQTLAVVLALGFGFAGSASAKDLGFRFTNGLCQDANGKTGLNPGFLGQCSDLTHVTMSRFHFEDLDLSGSVFSDADLQEATFNRALLTGVNFTNSNLSGVDFSEAKAHHATFQNAILVNAHLGTAELNEADLRGANLTGGLLSYIRFPGAKLSGAIFQSATMDHADLSNADLTGVNFAAVNLKLAQLDNAKLDGANFTGADLTGASLIKASAAGARFRRATIRQAHLTDARVAGSDFFNAQLDGADLDRADFGQTDLRSAVLKEASSRGTNFKGAQFSSRTVLPFSKDQASKLGMILGQSGHLLVISDSDQNKGDVGRLQVALNEQGIDLTVSPQSHGKFDGSLDLGDYSAILHITGVDYDTDMPSRGQKALVDFVAAGGTYIQTQYSGYMIDQNQKLQGLREILILSYQTGDANPHNFIPVEPQKMHPLLEGVSEFSVTADTALAPIHVFDKNPAYVVMQDDQGFPMVAARTYGKGKVVGFSFAINSDSSVLTMSPVQQLIQNAIFW